MIYADCAATIPVNEAVYEEICRSLKENWCNPSSLYRSGRESRQIIEEAREKCAFCIGADAGEVYFTSGGSESNNWAVKASLLAAGQGSEAVISATSHHSVINSAKHLGRYGYKVSEVRPESDGSINADHFEEALKRNTAVCSCEYVNNETGVIQPIKELAARAHKKGALFHADCVAAAGHLKIGAHDTGADMISISGHKIGAPKGTGLLYIRKGALKESYTDGGGQEHGMRAGTENIPYIVGLAKALEENARSLERREALLLRQKEEIISRLQQSIPGTVINGSIRSSVGGITNLSFGRMSGDELVLLLDRYGICASSGSACAAGAMEPSHVLRAMGAENAGGALRLSFYEPLSAEDINILCEGITSAVMKIKDQQAL